MPELKFSEVKFSDGKVDVSSNFSSSENIFFLLCVNALKSKVLIIFHSSLFVFSAEDLLRYQFQSLLSH